MIIRYRINNQITAPELRVTDENGESLGVMKREDAFRLAQGKGLDIIEIAPNAVPPVAKIISFDKFRYHQEKEEKKLRAAQKTKGLKQVRITVRAAENDFRIRAAKTDEFLKEGHKVEIDLAIRGREKAHRDWSFKKMEEFFKMITVPYQITLPPKMGGRGLMAQIVKK